MTQGLVRYQETGHQHFITFSCFGRKPLLGSAAARTLFECSLEAMRTRYGFLVVGYVIMPEHVHLLVTEPERGALATAIQALKISVSRQQKLRPFWSPRYYDFNVYTERKRVEKLRYIHRNPVARGLVERPEDWPWSSYCHYRTGAVGRVEIESWWMAHKKKTGEP
jgi:putative transposase